MRCNQVNLNPWSPSYHFVVGYSVSNLQRICCCAFILLSLSSKRFLRVLYLCLPLASMSSYHTPIQSDSSQYFHFFICFDWYSLKSVVFTVSSALMQLFPHPHNLSYWQRKISCTILNYSNKANFWILSATANRRHNDTFPAQ